jgi:hypothetical protein
MLYNFKNNFKPASVLNVGLRTTYECMYVRKALTASKRVGGGVAANPSHRKKRGLISCFLFFLPQSPAEPLAGRGAE